MAKIEPFCGVRFNPEKIKDLSKVICPPYDVINKQQRKAYQKKSNYNTVNLILPKGRGIDSCHKNAAKLFDEWLKKGILIRDNRPCIYIYQQAYRADKTFKTRLGFISLLEFEGKKKVLPHENIFAKFKFERCGLMKATQAHLSSIFIVFDDKGKKVEKALSEAIKGRGPALDVKVDGGIEKLWSISDNKTISKLRNFLANKNVFIADGHHRFEASLHLRGCLADENGPTNYKMPYDYTMVYFLSMQDKGLLILPTHRVIKKLPKGFSKDFLINKLSKHFLVSVVKNKGQLQKNLQLADNNKKHAFGFFYAGSYIFAQLKDENIIKNIGTSKNCLSWKKLDVSILHYFIFPLLGIKEKIGARRNVYYYKGKDEAARVVKAKEFKMAVFLNSTKIKEIKDIAGQGQKMPHKSTYFYPKLSTGVVFHKF